LENQRKDAAEKATAEWKSKYAWAEAYQPDQVREMQSWYQRAAQNPVEFAQQLIQELNADPVHSQALRSLAAKALASARGTTQPTMPQPDVAITDAQGQVVGSTYSDKALAQFAQVIQQQVLAQVDQKYAPVVQTHEQMLSEREQLRKEHAAQQWQGGFAKELADLPNFGTSKAAIGQEVVRMLQQYPSNDPRTDDPAFLEGLTLRAYNKVVLPTLQRQERTNVLNDLNQKAAASTASPTTSRSSAPKAMKDMTWKEAVEYEFAKRAGAARSK
jgi:hypothetical protein